MVTRGAHAADTDITSLAFSRDNLTLLSRAADDTVKVHLPDSVVLADISDDDPTLQQPRWSVVTQILLFQRFLDQGTLTNPEEAVSLLSHYRGSLSLRGP